jgi:hypothetical protein
MKEYQIGSTGDNTELDCSTDEATPLGRNPPPIDNDIQHEREMSKKRGKGKSKQQSPPCPTSFTTLDFKNRKHKTIGRLIIQNHRQAKRVTDISLLNEPQLKARWEECTPGLLANVRGKGKEIDKRILEWANKKSRGVLPWMINHMAEVEGPALYAVEHIRGGGLDTNQQVIKTYIW